MAELLWSEWFPYDDTMLDSSIRTKIPNLPGIYQVRIKGVDSGVIPGAPPLVYIGLAKSGIRTRVVDGRIRNSADNFAPLEKRLRASGFAMEFRYCVAQSVQLADQLEVQIMQEYESTHESLPLANRNRRLRSSSK